MTIRFEYRFTKWGSGRAHYRAVRWAVGIRRRHPDACIEVVCLGSRTWVVTCRREVAL